MELEKTVILTRHLATKNNRSGVIMGKSLDLDIVDDDQIKKFNEKIISLVNKYKITDSNSVVLSSPLKRCISTANIIGRVLQKSEDPKIIEDLTETDMGEFEGLTGPELRRNFPNLLDKWMYKPDDFQFPDGESYLQVSQRVNHFIKSLTESRPEKFVFVCSHVDIIKMFILKIQSKQFAERRSIDIPNGNVTVLTMLSAKKDYKIIDLNWNN